MGDYNVTVADFAGKNRICMTDTLYQYDYGQKLQIDNIPALPQTYEAHFSNVQHGGASITVTGMDGIVDIPNALLMTGKRIYCWIYVTEPGSGETEYQVLMPVQARPMPEYYDVTDTGAFDSVVQQVGEYAATATAGATNATASAAAAATSASEAAASASAAETAKNAAETAQGNAEDAQAAAETAAQTATEKAQQTAQDAAQAALDAGRAESAAGRAEAAETGAESAKTDAETAAQGAADSASAASASATSAGQAASAAAQSATAAAGSATTAQNAAQTATTKAGEASASADAAAASETAAQTAQTAAETAASTATASATTVTEKAAEAAQSASNAAASETAAEAAATRAETAAASLTVDSALSDTSVNPVENRVITAEVTQLKSAIDDFDTILSDCFKAEERTVTDTFTWTDGQYYKLDTGAIGTLSGYALTNKQPCRGGDIITVPQNLGQILFWSATAYISYTATSPSQETTVTAPEGAEYYALNNRDSTVRPTTCSRFYHRDVIIQEAFNAPALPIYDASYFMNKRYISTANGRVYTGDSYASWYSAYGLPCKPNHKYRTETNAQAVFYDENMTFISAYIPAIIGSNTTGAKVESDFTTPANCVYMAVNSNIANEVIYDLERVMYGNPLNPPKLIGKNVVCFGDSITGNYRFGDNYPYQIEEITGAKTYNVGFGGCRMGLTNEATIQYVNPFSMVSLADAIVSTATDKWDSQDSAAGSFAASTIIRGRLAILKSIDFSTVDVVTIAYGTNGVGLPLDDSENPLNTYTYAGAARYAIKTLLEHYPHLRIMLLTPIYRWYSATNDDSDTHQIAGQTLLDRVTKILTVGEEMKIPCIDLYHTLGINKYNRTGYFGDDDEVSDGTHINSFGREQMGRRVAGEMIRLF